MAAGKSTARAGRLQPPALGRLPLTEEGRACTTQSKPLCLAVHTLKLHARAIGARLILAQRKAKLGDLSGFQKR